MLNLHKDWGFSDSWRAAALTGGCIFVAGDIYAKHVQSIDKTS
jgi:hypothetical protein